MPNKNHDSELDPHCVSTCSFITHVNSTQTTIIHLIKGAIKYLVASKYGYHTHNRYCSESVIQHVHTIFEKFNITNDIGNILI